MKKHDVNQRLYKVSINLMMFLLYYSHNAVNIKSPKEFEEENLNH